MGGREREREGERPKSHGLGYSKDWKLPYSMDVDVDVGPLINR